MPAWKAIALTSVDAFKPFTAEIATTLAARDAVLNPKPFNPGISWSTPGIINDTDFHAMEISGVVGELHIYIPSFADRFAFIVNLSNSSWVGGSPSFTMTARALLNDAEASRFTRTDVVSTSNTFITIFEIDVSAVRDTIAKIKVEWKKSVTDGPNGASVGTIGATFEFAASRFKDSTQNDQSGFYLSGIDSIPTL